MPRPTPEHQRPSPGDRPGRLCLRAALAGAVLALALTGLPAVRLAGIGLDRLPPFEGMTLAAALLAGIALGRLGLRSRQHLFVVVVALTVVAATAALACALGLARVGDPGMLAALAAANGAAAGLLAPRGPLVLRSTAPLCGASGAVVTIAAARLGALPAQPTAVATAVVLAPVLALVAGRPSARSPARSPSPWLRPVGLAVLALLVTGLAAAAPTALLEGAPPVAPALLAAGAAGGLLAVLTAWRAGALAFAAVAAASLLLGPAPGPELARRSLLASSGATCAAYDRASQELQLFRGEVLVAAEGPDRPHSALLATVLRSLLHRSDRVLVLGEGSGRLRPALTRAGLSMVEVVPWRSEARPLRARLRQVGPVPDPRVVTVDPAAPLAGPQLALARRWDGSRQAIVVAEPLHRAAGWQIAPAFQRELRRVAGDGLVVQPFAMDRVPPAALHALLRAAADAHPCNAVLAVGPCALLLSAATPRWERIGREAGWSADARWQAHEAHLGGPADVALALRGAVAHPGGEEAEQAPADIVPGRTATLAVLRAWLRPGPPVAPAAHSLLLWWREQRARIAAAERQIRAASADEAGRAAALAAATPFLPCGAPSATLQAALGLRGPEGVSLRSSQAASLAAHAIDPLFFAAPPPVLAGLPRPEAPLGALEELASLPPAARLAELCSADTPQARALRARFPSPCARALVGALASAPLAPEQLLALRQLADPFVLVEAGRVLAARGATAELLGLWRGDLPMPAALRGLLRGGVEDRQLLAAALAGRRDARALLALADLLVDEAAEVRRIAGGSLFATTGGEVAYDADWPRTRRFLAAERVRSMHNRGP